jgi:hypothetical protein
MTINPKFKQPFVIALISLFVLAIIGLVVFRPRAVKPAAVQPKPLGTKKLIYYDEQSFWKGISQTGQSNTDLPNGSLGGIIPHHLLPGFIYSDFFKRWQKNPPKTIFLIGPNHKEKGGYKILTSLRGWQTPFGVVNPNLEISFDFTTQATPSTIIATPALASAALINL